MPGRMDCAKFYTIAKVNLIAFIKSLKGIICTYHVTDIDGSSDGCMDLQMGTDEIGMGMGFYNSYDLRFIGSSEFIIGSRVPSWVDQDNFLVSQYSIRVMGQSLIFKLFDLIIFQDRKSTRLNSSH